MWYDTLEFYAEKYEETVMPPIILDLYDTDGSDKNEYGDDYLCRAVIQTDGPDAGAIKHLTELKGREDVDYFNIPEPKWHDCFFKAGDSKSG